MAWIKKPIVVGTMVLLALGAATWFVLRLHIPHRLALAEGRRAIASHIAEPLDLTAYYEMPASRFEQTRNSSFPEWTIVPRGFQTFDHVPFQIDGIKCLWGAGNAKYGMNFAEQLLGIPVHRKFETLYVYHCAFFGAPNGTPVYELVFRYADDSSVTNIIRYGDDVFDWFTHGSTTAIGPTGPHSRLAWHDVYSDAKTRHTVRFCMTALDNPQPSVEVTSIDLFSSKNISAGCILAMTPGKSGLMR